MKNNKWMTKIAAAMLAATMITGTGAQAVLADDSIDEANGTATENGAAENTAAPEAPAAPVRPEAESYLDNDKIEAYNGQVDSYNSAAEAYNRAVDEEYVSAVAETVRKNDEIAQHNAAEEQRVKDAEARNEQAVRDAEEANRLIDEENEEGLRLAEQAAEEQYAADLAAYEEAVAQYEYDVKMEQAIKNAGYASVEQYNATIEKYYNEPARKSVEKNASAPTLSAADTYTVKEAEEKSGRMIRIHVEHNFEGTDISYSEDFEIDANDIITFKGMGAPAENTNPGYAQFYYNTDEAHQMGSWMQAWSSVMSNAAYNNCGWDCGDSHEISYKDGTVRRGDIEDIDVVYYYMWAPGKIYKTYNTPAEPTAPVKGEADYEMKAHVAPALEEIAEADIWTFVQDPIRRAYLEMMSYMDLFRAPEAIEDEQTPAAAPAEEDEDEQAPAAVVTNPNGPTNQTPNGTPGSQNGSSTNSTISQASADLTEIEEAGTPLAAPKYVKNAKDSVPQISEIAEDKVPMAGPAKGGAWALVNLICTALTILAALAMAITFFRKKNEEQDEEGTTSRKRNAAKFAGLVPAAASVIAFLLTEDMTNPMQLTDKWTILMLALLLVSLVIGLATRNRKHDEETEDAAMQTI